MSDTPRTPEANEASDGLRRTIDRLERELYAARAERDTHVAVTERIKVALRIRGTGSYVEWAEYCRESVERAERAEAECERLRTALLGVKSYREANPLGGPAKVFDAMADCIRAGDSYEAVLKEYGFVREEDCGPRESK